MAVRSALLFLPLLLSPAPAQVAPPPDAFFADEVWAKVGERTCLSCHRAGGDAAESDFLLRDAELDPAALAANHEAFRRLAAVRKDGSSRMLLKVSGGMKHGGGTPLKTGSTGYRILEEFVKRLDAKAADRAPAEPPFFRGITMASPRRLLRRATLSLAGRLPSDDELAAADAGRTEAVLDAVLAEEAFYDRLKEGWNDILLAKGYEGLATDALSYDHFEKTRHWAEKHDLDAVPEKERQKARYKLWDDYRAALLREPYELIAHVVRNGKPFTEIVTADYFMVSPYTARGYGIYDAVKDRFKDPADPFEFVPARLPALKGRNGKVQPTSEGIYPHAGLLSLFQYLRRYPTTVTNRNRLRARMVYRHFLGVDVMALAPRVTDAAAVGAKFANPTMEAPDCVVCHKTVDPLAGLFQDYFNEEGHFGPRKEGWFSDMFPPGLEGKPLPESERWRSLQWLGREIAADPRFAVAMVEHVHQLLLGRRPMLAPQDIDDPHFGAKRRAYLELRREVRSIADRFAKSGFDLKTVFKAWVASPFYGADGLAEAAANPERRAELDEVGVVHLLTPEQIERKIAAVFGRRWGRLDDSDSKYGLLYGGIDSKAVTERATDPSGAMGALQRILANDVACRNVPADFALEPSKRVLFPGVEPSDLPGTPEADARIRAAIVRLHGRLLGREHGPEHPEVERTFRLFADLVAEAKGRKGLEKQESYFCRSGKEEKRSPDPDYTLRAWRAVVTYLLRQDDFLYE